MNKNHIEPFSMEAYQKDPSVKYNRINQSELLLQEVAPSAKQGLPPDLKRDGRWYLEWLSECMDDAYVQEITSYITDEPRLRDLPPETENILIMPVGASGDTARIYATLARYQNRSDATQKEISILLWVNMLESEMVNPQSMQLADTTYDEIQRAKEDFSSLNIIDLYYGTSVQDVEITERTGGPWGIIMRKFYDVAMLTAFHHVEKYPNLHSDVLIIRNDSDPVEFDDDYLGKWTRVVASMREYDGYQGMSQFGNYPQKEALFPGLSLIMNFIPVFDRYVGDHLRFQAANFAFKASAYCQMGGMGVPYYTGIGSCDALLGERLKNVLRLRHRKGDASPTSLGLVPVKLITDWSRPLAAYLDNRNPQRAWTTWSDSPSGIKDRHSDLRMLDSDSREEFYTSLQKVEDNITRLLDRLNIYNSRDLLVEFFGSEHVFRLTYDETDNAKHFYFTEEGINAYRSYFESGIPYREYIKKQAFIP